MAFLRAAAGSFRAHTWAAHAHSGSQAHASLGSPDPPCRGHSNSTGSLGTCLETEAHPATQRTARVPMGHTSQQLSQHLRHSVRRKDLGTGGLGGGFSRGLSDGQASSLAR